MRAFLPKACADCGATFTPKGGGGRRCAPCARTNHVERRTEKNAARVAENASRSRRVPCSVDGCQNRVNVSNATGMCVAHARAVALRDRKAALRASGVCANCGKAPASVGGRCDACRKRRCERVGAEGINRKYLLRKKYGLTPEGWADLFARQGGRCAICETAEAGGKHGEWHTDHDHATGAVRGVLCAKCNWMLGHANDDPATLRRAAEYLRAPHLALVKETA